jgi:DNA helicase-2/ATP-dependent DNA helicase PcrA
MLKKDVLLQVFEQKMQNQMTNGQFYFISYQCTIPLYGGCLCKRDIPYRIYGGLSFIKEIKDVLCYLCLVLNPKDEEALMRVINYPARRNTTIENYRRCKSL